MVMVRQSRLSQTPHKAKYQELTRNIQHRRLPLRHRNPLSTRRPIQGTATRSPPLPYLTSTPLQKHLPHLNTSVALARSFSALCGGRRSTRATRLRQRFTTQAGRVSAKE